MIGGTPCEPVLGAISPEPNKVVHLASLSQEDISPEPNKVVCLAPKFAPEQSGTTAIKNELRN